MIIIIEGPDGAGKSTLAKKLSKQTGYPIKRFSYPRTSEEQLKMHDTYREIITTENNFIMDRCWYSEMVYGPIKRDQSWITVEQMYTYEKILATQGAMIIHCTDSTYTLWGRATERGEEYVTTYEQLNNIKNGYEALLHGMPHIIPVVRYELSKNKEMS